MVVVMQKGAAPEARERVLAEIRSLGFTPTSARASRAR
jgi:DNA-binding LacI/PurR family transcriptional regulator